MYFQKFIPNREPRFQRKTGAYEEHELHMHDLLEIHVLRESEATFATAQRAYDGKPGDVFLFRPHEPHWNLVKDRTKPIHWIGIHFFPSVLTSIPGGTRLLYPFYAVNAVSPYIPAESECAQAIQDLALRAVLEEERGRIGWESGQFVLFVEILVHLLRHTEVHSSTKPDAVREVDEGVVEAIRYILETFKGSIDMDEVLRISGRRRTYFYDKFKDLTGVSPNQFIRRLRMQMAAHLLSNTDKSVTDISFECGYQSIHYFIKHFHEYRGMSPREFRKAAFLS